MSETSSYLDRLNEQLFAPRRARIRIVEEARQYIEDATTAAIATGTASDEAERKAIREFGYESDVANAFLRERKEINMLATWSKYLAIGGGISFGIAVTADRQWEPMEGYWVAVPGVMLLVALLGMHLRQAARSGWAGRAGVILLGISLTAVAVFGLAVIAMNAFDIGDDGDLYFATGLMLLAAPPLVAGLILFAVSAFRGGVFPPAPVVLLIVGTLVLPYAFADSASDAVGIGAAWTFSTSWIWLGAAYGPLVPSPPTGATNAAVVSPGD